MMEGRAMKWGERVGKAHAYLIRAGNNQKDHMAVSCLFAIKKLRINFLFSVQCYGLTCLDRETAKLA